MSFLSHCVRSDVAEADSGEEIPDDETAEAEGAEKEGEEIEPTSDGENLDTALASALLRDGEEDDNPLASTLPDFALRLTNDPDEAISESFHNSRANTRGNNKVGTPATEAAKALAGLSPRSNDSYDVHDRSPLASPPMSARPLTWRASTGTAADLLELLHEAREEHDRLLRQNTRLQADLGVYFDKQRVRLSLQSILFLSL